MMISNRKVLRTRSTKGKAERASFILHTVKINKRDGFFVAAKINVNNVSKMQPSVLGASMGLNLFY